MDPLMDVIKNSEEPEWLERPVVGNVRWWQLVFLCMGGVLAVIVMVCCCFRFRIPRTKQQIEADYQRRMITAKFRQQLETIQDAKMDSMSLKDALELLYEKTKAPLIDMEPSESQPPQETTLAPPQASSEASGGSECVPEPGGFNFAKFATKVAHLSKLGQKSTTTPVSDKMEC